MFVILDAEGCVVNKDGRKAVSGDLEGENFPWKPKTINELLVGDVLTKDGSTKPMGSLLENKVLGLYFSAHWCPPCRAFTPELAKQYKKIQEAELPFEIVFVSSDKSEDAFKEYYEQMPWLALPYENRQGKEQLSDAFGVNGIPSLVLLDKDRSIITTSGRGAVMGRLEDFPWYPKPVTNLAEDIDGLNETTSVVLLCEGSDKAAQDAAYAALEPIALAAKAAAKASGEDPEFSFFIATSSEGPVGQIRSICELPSEAPATPTVVLLDIPDQGGFYLPELSEITESSLRGMLQAYKSKSLERKQLG
jgi:nucleoredoxin